VFWDILGEQGHPVRATVSELGPLLFSRLLELNETQSAVLSLVFKIADDEKMLLLDLKDLQAMVTEVGNHAKELATTYGNIATATIGAIQRGLVTLGEKGGDKFFGEPALNIDDLIQTVGGKGIINILAADKLMLNPTIYSTFLLWLLADLFEHMPEVGDLEKPKLVFFFDEAHLLFNEAPKILLEKIEQVVRLIRSKGIGVYFVTQSPLDIPDTVLGQLGNRVQHALHAFTPRDQKSVRAAAETFRSDGTVDVADVIMNLNVGEALVSILDEKGAPTVVERAWIAPPQSRFGAISPEERKSVIQKSLVFGHYETTIDRESAFELLKKKAETTPDPKAAAAAAKKPSLFMTFLKSAIRTMGVTISGVLVRGVLNNLIKGKK
jgi:DNA helicase HerA-like ATPase